MEDNSPSRKGHFYQVSRVSNSGWYNYAHYDLPNIKSHSIENEVIECFSCGLSLQKR